jgi:hypothetical protein
MSVTWVNHKGKKILFSNYVECKNAEEMIEVLHKEAETLKTQTTKVLVMADFTNSFPNDKYMDEVKKVGNAVLKAKIQKTATVGITGIKKILFKAYITFTGQKNIKLFDNQKEALDWLTE